MDKTGRTSNGQSRYRLRLRGCGFPDGNPSGAHSGGGLGPDVALYRLNAMASEGTAVQKASGAVADDQN
jgi:hypothetical protein